MLIIIYSPPIRHSVCWQHCSFPWGELLPGIRDYKPQILMLWISHSWRLCPHDLNIFQRPHFLIPSHWAISGGHKHLDHSIHVKNMEVYKRRNYWSESCYLRKNKNLRSARWENGCFMSLLKQFNLKENIIYAIVHIIFNRINFATPIYLVDCKMTFQKESSD